MELIDFFLITIPTLIFLFVQAMWFCTTKIERILQLFKISNSQYYFMTILFSFILTYYHYVGVNKIMVILHNLMTIWYIWFWITSRQIEEDKQFNNP